MDMDKTPKERIVFDEGVYYGDEGSEISIEDITSREGIAVEEVLDVLDGHRPLRGTCRFKGVPRWLR